VGERHWNKLCWITKGLATCLLLGGIQEAVKRRGRVIYSYTFSGLRCVGFVVLLG